MNNTLNLIRIHLKATSLLRSLSLNVNEALHVGFARYKDEGGEMRGRRGSARPRMSIQGGVRFNKPLATVNNTHSAHTVYSRTCAERHPKLFRENAITDEKTNILDLFIIPFAGIVYYVKQRLRLVQVLLRTGVVQHRFYCIVVSVLLHLE